jgi:hypothetical protein
MVKIRFKLDRVVQDGHQGTPLETSFSAGQVVDLPEDSANHWLTRGVAERLPKAEEDGASPAPLTSEETRRSDVDPLNFQEGSGDRQQGDSAEGDDPVVAESGAGANADSGLLAEQNSGASPTTVVADEAQQPGLGLLDPQDGGGQGRGDAGGGGDAAAGAGAAPAAELTGGKSKRGKASKG